MRAPGLLMADTQFPVAWCPKTSSPQPGTCPSPDFYNDPSSRPPQGEDGTHTG